MRNKLGDMFFPNLSTHRGKEWGDITVGGDLGDVEIDVASPGTNDDGVEGVWCYGVVLCTGIEADREYLTEVARSVVCACYESIGPDTFIGKVRWT